MKSIGHQAKASDWLTLARPHLGSTLVTAPFFDRLHDLASCLPSTGIYALELRLAEDASRVDLSLGLDDRVQATALDMRPWGIAIRRFLERWTAHEPPLAAVDSIWLEFDLDDHKIGIPKPIVCAKLGRRIDAAWLTESLFPSMLGQQLEASQAEWVRRCLDALPAGGRVLYAFDLGVRVSSAIRLELFGLDPLAMVRFLQRIEVAGLAQQVRDVTPIISRCDRFHLSIDLGDGVAPRIGLEGGFQRLPHREPGWRTVFDRLVANGLCTPDKREAVFNWPGYETRETLGRQWPSSAEPKGYFVRSLSHVKLVTWPDQAPEAKVYLLFQYLPRRPNARAFRAPAAQ